MRRTAFLLAVLVAWASAGPSTRAQGLGAAAEKEKERRAKQKASGPRKSYGDSDLGRVGAPIANDPSIAPAAGEPSAASGATSAATAASAAAPKGTTQPTKSLKEDEQYWRSRHQELKAGVAAAEAKVKAAESVVAYLGPLVPGSPEYRCEMIVVVQGAPPERRCAGQDTAAIKRAMAELESARKALDRAKKELDGLADEVRRAGAMPGWIR